MKRLFQINYTSSPGSTVRFQQAGYFDNKQEAKSTRDELNENYGGNVFCVSRGPDNK